MSRLSNLTKIRLYEMIFNRIYMARNITLDGKVIEDCLNDISRISGRFNSCNGEMSDQEVRVRSNKIMNELAEKYLP